MQVRPGDIVLGDDDGVVVVPRHRLAQVSDLAAEIAEREDAITAAVLSGATISDARKRFGYHTLQRRRLVTAAGDNAEDDEDKEN